MYSLCVELVLVVVAEVEFTMIGFCHRDSVANLEAMNTQNTGPIAQLFR